MKVVIQFSESEERKALPILLRHSPGTVLRDRVYIIDDLAAAALTTAGVRFTEVSRVTEAPSLQGAAGERI